MLDAFRPSIGRRFTSTSSQYMTVASVPSQVEPILMACWYQPLVVGATQALIDLGTSGGQNNRRTLNIGSNGLRFEATSRTTAQSSASSPTDPRFSAEKIMHGAAFFESATSRYAFAQGVVGAQEATSRVPTAPNMTTIGRLGNATAYANGIITWPAIWKCTTLAEAQDIVSRLYHGAYPLDVHRDNLLAFWDFTGSDTIEYSFDGTLGLANTAGSVPVRGPDFLYRRMPRRWVVKGAAASGAISGTAAIVFAAGTSTLTGSGALAGTAANVFGEGSSTLGGSGALASSAAIAFGAGSSTLAGSGSLAGSSAIVFSNSGTLSSLGSGAMAGTAAIAFAAGSTSLTGSGSLSGSTALVFDDGASVLSGSGALAGQTIIVFGAGSSMLIGSAALAGSADMVFDDGTSTLGGTALLSGTVDMIFAAGSSTLSDAGDAVDNVFSCGRITVRPAYDGIVRVSGEYGGTINVRPAYNGIIRVNEC